MNHFEKILLNEEKKLKDYLAEKKILFIL